MMLPVWVITSPIWQASLSRQPIGSFGAHAQPPSYHRINTGNPAATREMPKMADPASILYRAMQIKFEPTTA